MLTGLSAVVAMSIKILVVLTLFSCVVIMVGWLKSCKPDSLKEPLIVSDVPYSVLLLNDTGKATFAEINDEE